MTQPENASLSPVQEEATPTLDAEKIDGLIRGVLWAMDLVERGPAFNGSRYEVDRSRLTAARNGLIDIRRSFASALPALLEASRRVAFLEGEGNDAVARELARMHARWQEAETLLAGSISERETLTAQNAELQKMLEQERRAHGG